MSFDDPIITRTEAEGDFTIRVDYGTSGVSTAVVHMQMGTSEENAYNRRELNRVLARFGYGLKE